MSRNDGRLRDKVCLVTGAGSGQGREVAQAFAREGAQVIVAEIDDAAGEGTVELIADHGGVGVFVKTDVGDADAWERVRDAAFERFGRVDVLYNNAAILHPQDHSVIDTPPDVWEAVLRVNVMGIVYGCRAIVPSMLERGRGSVINISSLRALLGASTPQDAYTSSKGAIHALTRSLAVQFGAQGVRANAVVLGTIETPAIKFFTPEARASRIDRYPSGRFGQPRDVAQLAVYLASDESEWMNGSLICFDGGATAKYI